MLLAKDSDILQDNARIWIISEARHSEFNLKGVVEGNVAGPYKEYRISDIGRYLLNPHSIEVKKKLIGGEIHYKHGVLKKIRKLLRNILPKAVRRETNAPLISPEMIVSRYKFRIPPIKDPDLEAHLKQFYGLLRSHDSVAKKLALLDPAKVFEIVGICEDIGENYSYLKLKGSIEEKIKYLQNHVSREVGVILNRAHIADGLFELRGYDFESYTPERSYRLISYNGDGNQKACVLTDYNTVDFHLSDCNDYIQSRYAT